MPHDGAPMPTDLPQTPLLADLLGLTAAAVKPAEALLDAATTRLRDRVTADGRVSAGKLEQNQIAAHGLAWLSTYVEALRQMQSWAERLSAEGKFGEPEKLLHQIAFGEYLSQIQGGIPMSQGEILRPQDIGLTQDDRRAFMTAEVATLAEAGNTQAARSQLVEFMRETGVSDGVG
ncbi:MAG: acyl-CoA dehydrogenase, partial [Rhodobacteraceae bacterium CG17_big_fil_post_rev_8_21_14_2_50_65_11]